MRRAFAAIMQRFMPQLPYLGAMAKPKGKLIVSSLSNAKCMGAHVLTYSVCVFSINSTKPAFEPRKK